MNLLEINATKLFELFHTDFQKGLTDEDAAKNKKEFSSESRTLRTLFATVKSIFSEIMPLAFVVLSLMSLSIKDNSKAWFSLGLFVVAYVLLKYFSLRYVSRVSKTLNTNSAKCRIIRNGDEVTVDSSEIVPGDIMLLALGDVVPCDAIVLLQDGLRVSEIQLTGNSTPVIKMMQEDVLRGKGVPYYECILFAGSVVVSGYAKVLVCNVGKDVFDKKNKLTSRSKHARRTRIFEISSAVAQHISLSWMLISFIIFVLGIVKGVDSFNVLYLSITLGAASLPDMLMLMFDLNLYAGAQRLHKKGCDIRNMTAIDRMCDISCIAVDDTSYFRTSSPKPNTVYVNGERKKFKGAADDDVRELFEMAVVASISGERGMSYNGISVEHSLIKYAEEIGLPQEKLYNKYLLLEKRPFTEENGMGRVVIFKDGEFFIISIGSPSMVLKTCTHIENNGSTLALDEKQRRRVRDLSRVIARANEGVVAIAVKKIEYKEGTAQIINNRGYSFKGYIGLHTAIKADSARAVNLCRKCGTDVVLMSSEGVSTSVGFAKSLSILTDNDKVIERTELEKLDRGLFRADIKDYKVYIGLTPEEKAEIASYRKEDGDIIAVTVSGSEDLRLLLESDVSFCTAENAEEASGQNSDVIINGGFDLIPECIKFARSVYRNTRHMLQFVLNYQIVLLFSVVLSLIFMSTSSITPATTVLYSLLVSLPLAMSLAIDGVKGNEIKDTFGAQNLEINLQNLILIPSICGFVSSVMMTLSAKSAMLTSGSAAISCGAAFITLVSSAVFMAFALSADDNFDTAVFKNKYLFLSSVSALSVMVLFTIVKPLASLVGIQAPDAERYALSIITGFVPALVCIGIRLVKKYVFTNKNN